MTRLVRWPLAAVLAFLTASYAYALLVVVPWWALLCAGLLWALIFRARLTRRGPRSIGSERQVGPDA